jgi:hypothetical protein
MGISPPSKSGSQYFTVNCRIYVFLQSITFVRNMQLGLITKNKMAATVVHRGKN